MELFLSQMKYCHFPQQEVEAMARVRKLMHLALRIAY
jgi:hypothetical protein